MLANNTNRTGGLPADRRCPVNTIRAVEAYHSAELCEPIEPLRNLGLRADEAQLLRFLKTKATARVGAKRKDGKLKRREVAYVGHG